MATKITKAEKLVHEQMLALLEWASERPNQWHSVGPLESSKEAVRLLEKRGVVEYQPLTNVYRVKSKKF